MENEEQYLVSEIFHVFLSPENQALVQKVKASTTDYVFLPQTAKQLQAEPQPFLFSGKPQTIENVLLERLSVPKTPMFEYLVGCWYRAGEAKAQHSSDSAGLLKVADESLEIVKNYLILAVTTPEMFEQASFDIRTSLFSHCNTSNNPSLQKSKQLLYLVQEVNDDAFINELFDGLSDDKNLFYSIAILFITELRALIVFNSECQTLLDLFTQLCGNKAFKRFVIESFRMTALKNGAEIEAKPVLSAFFCRSILPYPQDALLKEFEVKAIDRVKSCKTKNAYLKTCEVSS